MHNPLDPESDDSSETPPDEAPEVPEATAPEVPETDLERPEAPTPSVPDLESQAETVNPEFRAAFWKLVVIFDICLFATVAGLLLIYFDGRVVFGGQLLIVGVAGLAYGLLLTVKWKRRLDSAEFDVVTETADTETAASDGGSTTSARTDPVEDE